MTQTECDPPVPRLIDGADLPAPGRWQIDPGPPAARAIGRHFMLTKVRGRFTGLSGVIEVAEAPGDSTVAVTVDMTTVESDNDARDEHLRSADFFDVAHHPTGTFSARAAGWQGTRGVLAGELTLRGVARPVTLQAEYVGYTADPWGGHRAVFTAAGTIDREDWGLTWNLALGGGGLDPPPRPALYDRPVPEQLTATSIPALLRRGAVTVAAGRVALGLTALAWPSVPARPWVGASADDLAARVFGRALGARDLALGLGALAALQGPGADPGSAAAWVAAGALSDALDVAGRRASGAG